MSVGEWVGKLSLIVIAYLVIYFTFGYFIAWKNAAVRAYYGGSDPGSFLAQMISVAARHALASAASSSACDIVDGHSGAGHPDDERSVVGNRVSQLRCCLQW